ncbi:MAG: helix-turn-helix transcriptional regulator [Pseudomonadota bacterium]|nr:helix-turn-helix transcriptional regulator [Pseudomonadota bacterium]
MLKHSDIWQAIDRLARESGLSASGLAKKAGLDPTTFNKSKRAGPGGRLRWPSTESISRILEATGQSLSALVSMIDGEAGSGTQRVPVIGYAQAGKKGFFDDAGYPVGNGWDELLFPNVGDPQAYALEVSGDSMEPVYRDGDILIVSPAAQLRRGDRVVVRTKDGEVMARHLSRQSANRIDLQSLNKDHEDRTLPMADVQWVARIMWVSQ